MPRLTDEPLLASLDRELAALRRAGWYRSLRRVERRVGGGAEVVVDGRPAVDFSSNDYLGLATDPRVADAAAAALRVGGTGAAASRSISGHHPLHEMAERELARLKGTEAALLFPSGFAANAGVIPALAGREDVIYTDARNHASVLDGCRLARAATRTFPHGDLDALAALLAEDRGKYRRRLIVVEGVYSMDGDVVPLDRLVPLAREHRAAIYLDDAHATGVLGVTGGGTAEWFGLRDAIDVQVGTLGKAFGVSGAFVAGPQLLREFLVNRARTFIFTTASPPALAAAALTAIGIAHAEPWRRARLRKHAVRLRDGLGVLGWRVSDALPGHIVPLVLGEAERAVRVGAMLLERGFLVGTVRPPSVPLGQARLRVTLSAAHTSEQIDGLLAALADTLPRPND